ncbi:Zinc finger CCHC domain-containing protein 8 [Choanephora cucurbitarum]|uniref:Zinc finger CCHC domain-containing protein 8 n=1 Tax=Choanephora cucurbitarum TaxID=101091 RepID=A0A1C7N225_9FUNG|nr:Zinc finger CCHC domain-containing protein 8 [Choanephora cucurbitarum]
MSLLRQQALDSLYNVLKTPDKYGDKFLVRITETPKDGLVSLDLLRNMAVVLNQYPVEYLAHCIPLDRQNRFTWNSDFSRVGLKELAHFFETNPYGFMQPEDQDQGDVFDEVLPVLYDHGKFYIDNEHTRFQAQDDEKKRSVYQYDLLDIEPLGKRNFDDLYLANTGAECFNCGSTEHGVSNCPLPKNMSRISRKKRELRENHARSLFNSPLLLHFEPGRLSDNLKEALGILKNREEPPYYANMRYYGYPPGYMKREDDPILKIYDGNGNEEEVPNTDKHIFFDSSHNKQTVEYPGLNLSSTQQDIDWHCQQQLNDYYQQLNAYQQQLDYQQQWEDYWRNQTWQWEEYNQNNSISYTPLTNKQTIITDDQSVDMDLSSDEDDS